MQIAQNGPQQNQHNEHRDDVSHSLLVDAGAALETGFQKFVLVLRRDVFDDGLTVFHGGKVVTDGFKGMGLPALAHLAQLGKGKGREGLAQIFVQAIQSIFGQEALLHQSAQGGVFVLSQGGHLLGRNVGQGFPHFFHDLLGVHDGVIDIALHQPHHDFVGGVAQYLGDVQREDDAADGQQEGQQDHRHTGTHEADGFLQSAFEIPGFAAGDHHAPGTVAHRPATHGRAGCLVLVH